MRFFVLLVLFLLLGCSREERDTTIDRITRAAKDLNGVEDGTPALVREQQRKERFRQDTKWTKENQALYPIEYCQAQLEELERMSKALQVQVYAVATSKTAIERQDVEERLQVEGLSRLFADAKETYRSAEVRNEWPMMLNGFRIPKVRAEEKIIEMAERIAALRATIENRANLLATYEKKRLRLSQEQRKLVMIREKVQTTLNDLQAKRVIEGANGIVEALNAIQDSMASLGVDVESPSLDELVIPDSEEERKRIFSEIMAK